MKWIAVLALGSNFAFAADSAPKYKTHFENPVVDSRIDFSSCTVTGALIGIAKGQPGDVLCSGTLKGDTSKKPRTIYVFKAEKRKTQDYFEETENKLISAVGDQAGGEQRWNVKLQELNDDLTVPSRPHVGTIQIYQSWDYSEGSVTVSGRLPGGDKKFDGALFGLTTVDQELQEFIGELKP